MKYSALLALAVFGVTAQPTQGQSAPSAVQETSKVRSDQISASSTPKNAPLQTTQIPGGSPPTQATMPPSIAAQGRTALSVRAIGGSDRCAQANPPVGACNKTVERNSAQFAQPRGPDLSPEQRLLIQLKTGTDVEAKRRQPSDGRPLQPEVWDALANAYSQPPPPEGTKADPNTPRSTIDSALGIATTQGTQPQ